MKRNNLLFYSNRSKNFKKQLRRCLAILGILLGNAIIIWQARQKFCCFQRCSCKSRSIHKIIKKYLSVRSDLAAGHQLPLLSPCIECKNTVRYYVLITIIRIKSNCILIIVGRYTNLSLLFSQNVIRQNIIQCY